MDKDVRFFGARVSDISLGLNPRCSLRIPCLGRHLDNFLPGQGVKEEIDDLGDG